MSELAILAQIENPFLATSAFFTTNPRIVKEKREFPVVFYRASSTTMWSPCSIKNALKESSAKFPIFDHPTRIVRSLSTDA